jgi:hypothetical protein
MKLIYLLLFSLLPYFALSNYSISKNEQHISSVYPIKNKKRKIKNKKRKRKRKINSTSKKRAKAIGTIIGGLLLILLGLASIIYTIFIIFMGGVNFYLFLVGGIWTLTSGIYLVVLGCINLRTKGVRAKDNNNRENKGKAIY